MQNNAPWSPWRPEPTSPSERWGHPSGNRPLAPLWSGLAALRPASPGQLALVGVGLWLVGVLVHGLAALTTIGIGLLIVAGLSLLIRPRTQEMYWRGRRIELTSRPSMGERLYRLIYRRG